MKGIKTWSFKPYKPLDFESEEYLYICRLAPGPGVIAVEWLDKTAEHNRETQYTVCFKRTADDAFSYYSTQDKHALLTGLDSCGEYELYVKTAGRESERRLARTGFVPGTVVNYLHPDNPAYSFSGRYLCSPSLVKLPGGGLIASMDVYASKNPQNLTLLFRSDDGGENWLYLNELFPCFWGKLFVHKGVLYMLAMSTEYGDLLIGKSEDGGKTFGMPEVLFRGSCSFMENGPHKAPMPVTSHAGRLWTAIDYGAWSKGGHASSLLSVDENADLLDASNWSLTKPLKYDPSWKGAVKGESRGLLEGSAVVSPNGDIYNFLGYRTGGCVPDKNRAVILKGSVEEPDKPLSFYKTVDFYGNRSKFSVRYDDVSGMYFSVVNRIKEAGGDGPESKRNIASLSASPDLEHWRVLCDLLDYSNEDPEKVAFQYVDFLFDGEDLLFLSRTAFNRAASFHDSNYITFHKVKNFRGLL